MVAGLFVAVLNRGRKGEGGGVLGACFVKLSARVVCFAKTIQDLGFAGPVADLAAQGQSLSVAVGGLLVVTPLLVDLAEVG